jgi:hypothetical protein
LVILVHSRGLIAAIVCVVVGVSGCTTSEAGKPTSAPTSSEAQPTSTAATTRSASPTIAIPPRPRAIKLDAIDPCALFTDPQRTQLGINRARPRTNESETYSGSKECVLNVSSREPFYNYSALLVTSEGVGPWFVPGRNADVTLVSVGGYAAAKIVLKGSSSDRNSRRCSVSIDAAEGQQLMITMDLTTANAFTQDQICLMSEQAAGLAVATLQTLA